MNIKRLISSLAMALCVLVSFQASAGNISASTAHSIANSFLKSRWTGFSGSFNAPASADLRLVHAEPSRAIRGTNVFYAFNIRGGGFIIVAGEDHATPVLGYSDKGYIDFKHLPAPLKDLLDGYKEEIEYLQTLKISAPAVTSQFLSDDEPEVIVEPLTKSNWGPEMPFYTQCPVLDGQYSKVGCAGVSMAQMLYFWKYPFACDGLPAYFGTTLDDTIPALPATTFNYDNMLTRYSHWDYDEQVVVQDTYTPEQALEVAKLCRYCGQAAKMNYSPTGSGTSETNKLNAMIGFGFSSNALSLKKSKYTLERWQELIRIELDNGRPVMYGASGTGSPGHAFILDGYNSDDYFHINMGWYGWNDAWYAVTAIKFINRYGNYRVYNYDHFMIIRLEPPFFCIISADDITSDGGLLFLGDTFNPTAVGVDLNTSSRTLTLGFSLTDADGTLVASSDRYPVKRHDFEPGTDVGCALMLPSTLSDGTYNLQFNYRDGDDGELTAVENVQGQLVVFGPFAKFNAPFTIGDVVDAIDYILNGNPNGVEVSIANVVDLIDMLLDS